MGFLSVVFVTVSPRWFHNRPAIFTAHPKDPETCRTRPNRQRSSPAPQPRKQAAAGCEKEGTSAQSGRKGFSQQLFATLQGAAEAAH